MDGDTAREADSEEFSRAIEEKSERILFRRKEEYGILSRNGKPALIHYISTIQLSLLFLDDDLYQWEYTYSILSKLFASSLG